MLVRSTDHGLSCSNAHKQLTDSLERLKQVPLGVEI